MSEARLRGNTIAGQVVAAVIGAAFIAVGGSVLGALSNGWLIHQLGGVTLDDVKKEVGTIKLPPQGVGPDELRPIAEQATQALNLANTLKNEHEKFSNSTKVALEGLPSNEFFQRLKSNAFVVAGNDGMRIDYGHINKAGQGDQLITFHFEFLSPPVVIISPYFEGQYGQMVSRIDYIPSTSTTGFTVTSKNSGASFFIDYVAIGK
jgi:hypothetical protein